jgi:hypothetical protein
MTSEVAHLATVAVLPGRSQDVTGQRRAHDHATCFRLVKVGFAMRSLAATLSSKPPTSPAWHRCAALAKETREMTKDLRCFWPSRSSMLSEEVARVYRLDNRADVKSREVLPSTEETASHSPRSRGSPPVAGDIGLARPLFTRSFAPFFITLTRQRGCRDA